MESGLHGGQGGLAVVAACHVPEKDPRLSFHARLPDVLQSGREQQDRSRRCPAVLGRDVASVLWPGLLRQDGVCLARVHDQHQHLLRATVHAEGDGECRGLLRVALQLGLIDAAAAQLHLIHQQEAAGRLVDVHDAVCADSVCAHEPAQFDEEPVRVGVLLLRAVELLHALGGFLAADAHATQELLDPSQAGTGVDSPCLEPLEHQATDSHRAEAQDVARMMSTPGRVKDPRQLRRFFFPEKQTCLTTVHAAHVPSGFLRFG